MCLYVYLSKIKNKLIICQKIDIAFSSHSSKPWVSMIGYTPSFVLDAIVMFLVRDMKDMKNASWVRVN